MVFYRPRRSKYRTEELEKLSSAERHILKYKNFDVKVATWGEGSPILFMHGWEGRGLSFMHFIGSLVQAGYKVILMDAPGHGLSTGKDVDLTDFIGTIDAVFHKMGPIYGIVAHSFGGLATLLALKNGHSIKRVVILSSPSSPKTVLQGFGNIFNLSEDILERIKSNIEKRTGQPITAFFPDQFSASLTAPTLIIHDKEDQVIAYQEAVKLDQILPSAQLESTSGLGHQRILRNQQVITQISSFLKN